MGKLCQFCTDLPLERDDVPSTDTYYSLGTRRRFHKSATKDDPCPFCSLIYKNEKFQYDGWDDLVYLTWTKDGFVPGKIKGNPKYFGHRLIVPMHKTGKNIKSPYAQGRIIDNAVEGSTLLKWLNNCLGNQHNHHDACINPSVWATGGAGSSRKGLSHLRLFNVKTSKIEEFKPTDPFPKYVVLSYVIGKNFQLPAYSLEDFQKYETQKIDTEALPITYIDAIRVVDEKLNLKYLWVDALCLVGVPEDDEDHTEGIENMDRIYNQAVLTIVAADGDHADVVLGAIHDRKGEVLQDFVAIPSGREWGLVTGLYWHTQFARGQYLKRGWTYQELKLSHRCLFFIDGLAFFRCRTRMYTEDTFWDDYDNFKPSDGMMTTPYEIDFFPEKIEDPLATYSNTLWQYRQRELGTDKDTLNAYRGILNRINDYLHTRHVQGLPEKILEAALIWYHRPDYNFGRNVKHLDGPTWSWTHWKGSHLLTFGFAGTANEHNKWLQNYTKKIEFWYTNSKGNNLRQADTGISKQSEPGQYAVPDDIERPFLQFYTRTSTEAVVSFGHLGGKIKSGDHDLLGYVFPDDLKGNNHKTYTLAQLSQAPNGDSNFYYERTEEGDDGELKVFKQTISAEQDLRWVLLLEYDDRGFYLRRGLGFIPTDQLDNLRWKKKWIAVG